MSGEGLTNQHGDGGEEWRPSQTRPPEDPNEKPVVIDKHARPMEPGPGGRIADPPPTEPAGGMDGWTEEERRSYAERQRQEAEIAKNDAEAYKRGHARHDEGMVDVVLYTPGPEGVDRTAMRRRLPISQAIQLYADLTAFLRGWEDQSKSAFRPGDGPK